MFKKKYLLPVIAILLILSMALVAGCGNKEETKDQSNNDNNTAVKVDELKEVLKVADTNFFGTDKTKTPTIAADDVKKLIDGTDTKYYILSVRKAEHYAKGHLKGSVNIPFLDIYKADKLATLPKDKKIVVVCYTGHTASQSAMLLTLLGYDAVPLKFGMMGWTKNDTVYALASRFTGPKQNLPTVTTATEATASYDLPKINTGKTTADEIIKALAEANIADNLKTPTIAETEVLKAVQVKDATKFIVDIRKPEHYAAGHIEGAINIPFAQMAKEESLKKLPSDKEIVVVCYTGHTASYTTMFLNLLGYNAKAMKFGMSSWTADENVLGQKPYSGGKDFPTVTN